MGLVQSQDAESMDDDFAVDLSMHEGGRFPTAVPCVEGSVLPMVGASIGGAESEGGSTLGLVSHTQNFCNPKESFEATRMDLEGGGKAFTSC